MGKPKNRDEYRQTLADEFAHILEEQGLEWTREWSLSAGSTPPYNAVTKARYRGTNAFYLSMLCMTRHYNDPRWVTMVQIMDKNSKYHPGQKWHLQAGSKAAWVEYWYPYDLIEKKAMTWEQYQKALTQEGRSEDDFRLYTRYTPVFNASMVDGMPPLEQKTAAQEAIRPDELIERLSENMGVPIYNDGGDQAFYRPSEDAVHLPRPEQFESEYAYNSTALHELAHASGHPSRLNRDQSGGFGSPEYAYEELIAEMTACFMGVSLCAEASRHHIENHKAYVQGWIQSVRDKPDTLIHAIKDAQSAAHYMDYKAELIALPEYQKLCGSVKEVDKRQVEPDTPKRSAVMGRISQEDNEVIYLGREAEPDRAYYFMAESLNLMTLAHITQQADHYVIIAPKAYLSADWMDRHNIEFWKLDREITLEGTRQVALQLGCPVSQVNQITATTAAQRRSCDLGLTR